MRSVGIEIGGTFTDLVAVGPEGVRVAKVPSTPARPEEAAFHALQAAGIAPADITEFVHGSTVATNAVLERRGARLALLATAGFRDLLLLGRQDKLRLFDLHYRRPRPLVAREDSLDVPERMLADGTALEPFDAEGFAPALEAFLARAEVGAEVGAKQSAEVGAKQSAEVGAKENAEVGAVAICLVNVYANPAHEAADPPETLRQGDFYMTNHPYRGAHHLSDILIFMPCFVEGRIIGYAAAVAHHIDMGGGAPGVIGGATDLYGEGLILPPARWSHARDWQDGNLRRVIAANIRVPEQTLGDIDSQFAACFTGLARLRELCARYGTAVVEAAMAGQIAYVERRLRAAISALPDGTYHGEDFLDDDGLSDAPLPVRAQVTIAGDRLSVDFFGTAPQVSTHLNAPFASVVSGALAALKSFLTDADTPFNEGAAQAVQITVPEGTLLNPRFPAPVGARMEATYRAYDAVLKALGAAAPERAVAVGYDSTTLLCLTCVEGGRYRVFTELRDGGNGAWPEGDGADAVAGPLSNCTNVPVEAIDADYGFFRVEAYRLLPDSGGRGRHRGGHGLLRRYRILAEGVRLALYCDRFRVPAEGLVGGGPGAVGGCAVLRGTQRIAVRSKADLMLQTGDVVEMWTGGGGGHGAEAERSAVLREADARLSAG